MYGELEKLGKNVKVSTHSLKSFLTTTVDTTR